MDGIDWPEIDVPAEALLPGAEPEPAKPVSPPASPPAATPPPVATPAAAPAAGAPGTTGTQPATPPDTGETVPKYRLDETIEARNAAVRRSQELEAELARLRAQPPARPMAPAPAPTTAAGPARTPEEIDYDEKVRARLQELYPELKHLKDLAALAERRGDIEASTDAIRGYREAETRFYDRHTETQIGNLHGLAAEHVLGAGKVATDLPDMVREALTQRFAAWVGADPGRSQRYNDLDTKLVGEFWPIFRAAMYDPLKRAESAAAVTAAMNRQPLPLGGSVSAPAPAAPPKPAASETEDEIHLRAWKGVEASRG